jgi:hypothetical protein
MGESCSDWGTKVAKKIFESRPEVGIEVGSGMARRWGE